MGFSQRELACLFLGAVAVGLAFGVLYDVLRLARMLCGEEIGVRRTPLQDLLLGVTDFIFSLLACLSLILLLYYLSDGQFRALAPVGMAAGFFLYMQTLGRLTVLCAKGITCLLRLVILLPMRWLWERTVGKILLACRVHATKRRIKTMVDAASRGFLPPHGD